MAKNAVTEWDIIPANNGDVAGINIAEGCPASGINDALRALMAQFAIWLASTGGPLPKSGGVITGAITGMGNGSTVFDGTGISRAIGYRSVPLSSKASTYTLALSNIGQGIATSAGVIIPTNANMAFTVGDAVIVYNASGSSIIITQSAGVILRLAGSATTGNRSLAQRGLATLLKVGSDEWVVSGTGVS